MSSLGAIALFSYAFAHVLKRLCRIVLRGETLGDCGSGPLLRLYLNRLPAEQTGWLAGAIDPVNGDTVVLDRL
jgi:hypothetical protein